jgi:hypothetical protein
MKKLLHARSAYRIFLLLTKGELERERCEEISAYRLKGHNMKKFISGMIYESFECTSTKTIVTYKTYEWVR